MLDISWSAVYAIYAVHYLARNMARYVTVQEIADRGSIPAPFLATLLPTLKSAQIVRARRGRGYKLDRLPQKISVYDIIIAVDGPRAFPAACAMKSLNCKTRVECALGEAWEKMHRYLAEILGDVTVDRLPTLHQRPACVLDRAEESKP